MKQSETDKFWEFVRKTAEEVKNDPNVNMNIQMRCILERREYKRRKREEALRHSPE